jgi:lysozyme family protein
MADNFPDCLAVVLREEGGFVNNPHDPGGMTCLGVTKAVWERWCGHSADESDMRTLTARAVGPLYRTQYWNAIDGDNLPKAAALCVFDFGVNTGPVRAARFFQQIVGASQDGHLGPATVAALNAFVAKNGLPEVVRRYTISRLGYYKTLDNFVHFGRGWTDRTHHIESAALKMCP